jgi:hypothetical protein
VYKSFFSAFLNVLGLSLYVLMHGKMAPSDSMRSKCSSLFDQTSRSDETNNEIVMCVNCSNLKDYTRVIIAKLNTARLVISILQDELNAKAAEGEVTEQVCLNKHECAKESQTATSPTVVNERLISPSRQQQYGLRIPIIVNRTTNLLSERIPGHINLNDGHWHRGTHIEHNLLLLGDSHIRGLAERIKYSLGTSYGVTGVTKPNADLQSITAPFNFSPDYLTKLDAIIVCGGTRDVSINETERGLRSLTDFAQRTTNTNVIILEIPLRYDLPLTSCVNTEVKSFNERIQRLATQFDHIKIFQMTTERKHHTRHGLHLNKLGKHLIASNLVNEINHSYFKHRVASPEGFQGKDINDNSTVQVRQTIKS